MEDKWFIFFEEDTLFCHRSWTGLCVYEVYFEGSTATNAVVNRDPEHYRATDDARDRQLILHLIKVLLLGQPSSYPPRPDLDPREQTLEQWSFMGQAMLSPDCFEDDQQGAVAGRDDCPPKWPVPYPIPPARESGGMACLTPAACLHSCWNLTNLPETCK